MGVRADYSVRRIDGRTYEDRLNDVITCKFFDYQVPCGEEYAKDMIPGELIWKNMEPFDPWERLIAAVTCTAAHDLIDAVEHNREKEIDELVDWFRSNSMTETVLVVLGQRILRSKSLKKLHKEINMIS